MVGFGVHTSVDVVALDLRSSLEAWASLADGPRSAFAATYLGPDHGVGPARGAGPTAR